MPPPLDPSAAGALTAAVNRLTTSVLHRKPAGGKRGLGGGERRGDGNFWDGRGRGCKRLTDREENDCFWIRAKEFQAVFYYYFSKIVPMC